MFGMKPDDVLGLAEDLTILRNVQRPSADIAAIEKTNATLEFAHRAIKERNDGMRKLKFNLDDMTASYSDLSAAWLASRRVIDAMCDELAKARGIAPETMRARAYAALSRDYDQKIGNMVSTGVLAKDPRQDPEVMARPTRDWYQPEV